MKIAFEEEKAGAHPTNTQIRASYDVENGDSPLVIELSKVNPCPIYFTNMPSTFLLREENGVVTASWLVTSTDLETAKEVADAVDAAIADSCRDYQLVMSYIDIAKKLEGRKHE